MQNLSKKEREILKDPRLEYEKRKEKIRELEKIRIKIAERVFSCKKFSYDGDNF